MMESGSLEQSFEQTWRRTERKPKEWWREAFETWACAYENPDGGVFTCAYENPDTASARYRAGFDEVPAPGEEGETARYGAGVDEVPAPGEEREAARRIAAAWRSTLTRRDSSDGGGGSKDATAIAAEWGKMAAATKKRVNQAAKDHLRSTANENYRVAKTLLGKGVKMRRISHRTDALEACYVRVEFGAAPLLILELVGKKRPRAYEIADLVEIGHSSPFLKRRQVKSDDALALLFRRSGKGTMLSLDLVVPDRDDAGESTPRSPLKNADLAPPLSPTTRRASGSARPANARDVFFAGLRHLLRELEGDQAFSFDAAGAFRRNAGRRPPPRPWAGLGLDDDAADDDDEDVDDDDRAPDGFRCPITLDLMRDPVVLLNGSGHSFERRALQAHLRLYPRRDPLTNIDQRHPILFAPNRALRAAIDDWREKKSLSPRRTTPPPPPPVLDIVTL